MKKLVLGILAHVDSGKTTLSEGLLYNSGEINSLGRVDHKNSYLDTNAIEKDRGITIFSHQATIKLGETEFTLLDTPGHVDFSAEAERTLRVLDYAVLVISGTDGVQSHTKTLWKLLEHYNIPVFIFVNKMDIANATEAELMENLCCNLSSNCIDFTTNDTDFYENIAMASEELLSEYSGSETIAEKSIQEAILKREVFPCFFGSALKNHGVLEFLNGIEKYTAEKKYGEKFGARVFKISEDEKGQRLTHIKITGGSLKVKDVISIKNKPQKVNEIRIYSGEKYKSEPSAQAGEICAITGISGALPGDGIGCEPNAEALILEPFFNYSVKLVSDININEALSVFLKLEQEETQMHVIWNEHLQKIDVQLMGEVQLEVLKRILNDRFGIEAEFEHGSIIYKETIVSTVEGVGHYEPLRHYAEVHLLLEPGKRGSGLVFDTKCSEDILDKNWQRLIMSHLSEKTHIGVLSGSPITDMKITLVNGRAHLKHTEGGDFRQATYRAVRQGLMQAESILLEPYYSFNLELPTDSVGRAMTDLQQMGAEFGAPQTEGEMSLIKGSAPVSVICDYQASLIAYTRGQGRLSCIFKGYDVCKNQDAVLEKIGYNCSEDLDNTPNSVFCAKGSGFTVKWDEVYEYMHIPALKLGSIEEEDSANYKREYKKEKVSEDELLRIYEMTYGKVKRSLPPPPKVHVAEKPYKMKEVEIKETYLLIDGYNIIFAWPELKKVADESLEDARIMLINRVCNYQALKRNNVILVFDAYKVKGSVREVEKVHGISVVYTKEAETADAYIEKITKKLCKNNNVRVATSDHLEQIIIFGHGAVRIPASEFYADVCEAEKEMRDFIRANNEMGI